MAIQSRHPSDLDHLVAMPPSAHSVPVPDPTTLTNQFVSRAISALREIVETRLDASDKAVSVSTRSTELLYAERFRLIESKIDANRIAFAERCELLDRQTFKAAADIKPAIDAAFAAAASAAQKQEASFTKQIDQITETLPKEIEAADVAIRRFYDEKFRSLDAQTSKAALDVRAAMEAAFVAAAGAQQKQEAAFTKQIDQLTVNVQLISKVTDDKLADLKDRIVAMEGRTSISDPTTAAALRDMAVAISVLKSTSDVGEGGSQQRTESSTWIFGAVAAVVAVGVLVLDVIGKIGH